MMNLRNPGRLWPALTCTVVIVACHSKSGIGEKDFKLEAVQEHIREMNKSYGDRFEKNDTAFYTERYCKDIVIMPEQMPQISGRDSVRLFNYNEGRNKGLKIKVTATKIYGGPEFVIEEGHYEFPATTDGSVEKGKFIAVWKYEDLEWKLFREIWNRDRGIE
jgi:ketosteroid isomerase-like protein